MNCRISVIITTIQTISHRESHTTHTATALYKARVCARSHTARECPVSHEGTQGLVQHRELF